MSHYKYSPGNVLWCDSVDLGNSLSHLSPCRTTVQVAYFSATVSILEVFALGYVSHYSTGVVLRGALLIYLEQELRPLGHRLTLNFQ